MKLEVLLSCMNENDLLIIQRSNLDNVNTLVINQCKTDNDFWIENGKHRMYNTSTRGLSVSRNLAIQHTDADVCLISDDDEVFRSGLEGVVVSAYERFSDADVIAFGMENFPTRLGDKAKRLKKYDLLKVSSCQISFRASSVRGKVRFDPKLGAGTQNGAGEENKFLFDCYKAGLNIYYVPEKIATVAQEQSTWFKGYDEKYFFDRGKTTRYILGFAVASLYAVHFLITKRKRYIGDISMPKAAKALFKGIMTRDIDKKHEQVKKD